MLSQKLLSIFLLLLLFLPGVLFTLTGGWEGFSLPDLSSLWDGTAVQPVENAFSESFVGRDFLCGAAAELKKLNWQAKGPRLVQSVVLRKQRGTAACRPSKNFLSHRLFCGGLLSFPCFFAAVGTINVRPSAQRKHCAAMRTAQDNPAPDKRAE